MNLAPASSPIILLPPASSGPVPTPGYGTSAGGILVPSLTPATAGPIVAASAADLDRLPQLLQEAHSELSQRVGGPAADALLGASMATADSVEAKLRQQEILAAFTAGDIQGALDAAGRR